MRKFAYILLVFWTADFIYRSFQMITDPDYAWWQFLLELVIIVSQFVIIISYLRKKDA